MRSALLGTGILLLVGCGRPSGEPTSNQAPAPAASASATPVNRVVLGEPITATPVALADIARDPARYRGETVTTSGRVTSVCKEMGCWLELADADGRAHVRIHGHSFFVPKTAPGHLARVQAKVVSGGGHEPDEDCAEPTASGSSGHLAKIELEASGVEID